MMKKEHKNITQLRIEINFKPATLKAVAQSFSANQHKPLKRLVHYQYGAQNLDFKT
jgi:hypothetical protein